MDVKCRVCGIVMRRASKVDIAYLPVVTTSGMRSEAVVRSLCDECRAKIGRD